MRGQLFSDAGYTLIEMVVAMLLLCFIAVAVASGIRFGSEIWERSQSRLSDLNAIVTAQNMLRLVLGGATLRYQDGLASFHGTPFEIDFDGHAPLAFESGGLVHFQLRDEQPDDAGGHRLDLQMNSLLDKNFHRETGFADGAPDLRFSYLDARQAPPIWLAYWRDRERLPDAIRIEENINPSPAWPTLIVRLPIAESADCVFDPVSLVCRKT